MTRTGRLWRYVVTEVGGKPIPGLKVGSFIIDEWHVGDWTVIDLNTYVTTSWWSATRLEEGHKIDGKWVPL
jgi:hypothetical protein